jgi:hypothetical protein
MDEYLDASAEQPIVESFTHSQEPVLQPVQEPRSEVMAPSSATSREGNTNSHPPLWQPDEPQFTKAIADYYGVSRKSVQEWFQKVKEACPWFAESDLKLPDGRYSPIAVDLMGNYRMSGLPFKAWKAQIWEQNVELVAAFQASQPAQTEQPSESSTNNNLPKQENHSNGLTLHLGSNLALSPLPSIVSGDDTAYLTQAQQRLQEFEELQQQILTQMQEQYEQTQALNARYREATSISDQLLLKEFQLKGMQLGYTALQLKQQAFKATVQAAEAGTLPTPGGMPGKPLEDTLQPTG